MSKQEHRNHLRRLVETLPATLKQAYSEQITHHASSIIGTEHTTVGCYHSTKQEPNLSLLHFLNSSVSLCYPRCEPNHRLQFYRTKKADHLVSGRYGIKEPIPSPSNLVSSDQLQLILCPGWGFSMSGKRLGKGGGYYDRFLAQSPAQRIGVCFHCQLSENIPTASHDLLMDAIITEKGIFKVAN